MDPIGFGYSQFDVVGRFSPVDHGVTEDGAGELVATDVDGTFHGPVELAQRLVASTVAKQCVSEAFAEFALGRSLRGDVDDATIARLAQSFAGGDFVALMTAIVNDDAFRLRDTTALEGPLP